jgi:hypothetical protein
MRCSWCERKAVTSTTRTVGEAPANPDDVGTKKDERTVRIYRACEDHRSIIEWEVDDK